MRYFVLIALLWFAAKLEAQPFGGVYFTVGYPRTENIIFDYTAGGSIIAGYQFNSSISLAGMFEAKWLPTRYRDLTISEILGSLNYSITHKLPVVPYIGISAGGIRRVISITHIDYGLVASPLVGFEAGVREKGFFFDASLAYKVYTIEDYVPEFNNNMDMFFVRVGVKYKF